jgi:parvulin-like peptidyl-prolyl isomerase
MNLIYQGKQLKLHKRAACLLELLKAAQARQTIHEKDLVKWRQGTYDDPIRLMRREEDILIKIARMNQVQKRILKSYHFLILDLYEITEDFMLPINLLHF